MKKALKKYLFNWKLEQTPEKKEKEKENEVKTQELQQVAALFSPRTP